MIAADNKAFSNFGKEEGQKIAEILFSILSFEVRNSLIDFL